MRQVDWNPCLIQMPVEVVIRDSFHDLAPVLPFDSTDH
jgi:hypothetical protein